MKNINEELLSSWLRLSIAIVNEKLVSDLTYNESLICNILYKNMLEQPERNLTATDLCTETRILKSQMNRTLNDMEAKNYITRERSLQDKRQVFIRINPARIEVYHRQHQKILALIDDLANRVGTEKIQNIIDIFNLIADTAEEVIK